MDSHINIDNANIESGSTENGGEIKGFDKVLNKLLVAVFVIFIFGFAIWSIILPDVKFSEQENRMLQQFPQMSSGEGSISDKINQGRFLDNLFDGSYASDMNKYLTDQFPLRNNLVEVKAAVELAMFKQQNDDVVLGKDEYLFVREDNPSKENLEKNIKSISDFFEKLSSDGKQTIFAPVGRNEDVETIHLPDLYSTENSSKLWAELEALSESAFADYLDLRDILKEKADSGDAVYYRTDHHWTSLGAYYAYREVISALGETPYDIESFDIETVSTEFYGTTWSSSGMRWISPDSIEFYRYDGDEDYITSCGSRTMNGFYDLSYLNKKDKYSAFLSGNEALVTIKASVDGEATEEREKLLIIKDSFSHSLAPFLARHYDLYLLDPRYSTFSVSEFIENNDIDKVAVIACISTLTEGTAFSILYS